MHASTELRAVLDAARLRAEGVFAPVNGGGEDKLVEATVRADACAGLVQEGREDQPVEAAVCAHACTRLFHQGLEDLWLAFPPQGTLDSAGECDPGPAACLDRRR